MRQDKLTTKFQQALSEAQSIALAHDNQFIEPVHVLAAMLADEEGGTVNLPKVSGTGGDVQVSRDLGRALNLTEKEAMAHGDEFISSEMFLLALTDNSLDTSRLLGSAGVTRKMLEAAIAHDADSAAPHEEQPGADR